MKRAEWLGLLARADTEQLAGLWSRYGEAYEPCLLAGPETGMIRLTTKAGAACLQFTEATCTRCVISLRGVRGYAVQLGSDKKKAEISACLDALLHSCPHLRDEILAPIRANLKMDQDERDQVTAATSVHFFTTRTSKNKCGSP